MPRAFVLEMQRKAVEGKVAGRCGAPNARAADGRHEGEAMSIRRLSRVLHAKRSHKSRNENAYSISPAVLRYGDALLRSWSFGNADGRRVEHRAHTYRTNRSKQGRRIPLASLSNPMLTYHSKVRNIKKVY